MIDANKAACPPRGNGQGVQGGVGQHIDPDRQAGSRADAIASHRHVRRGLGADVLRLGERNVAVVLDDQPIEAGLGISACISESPAIDRRHAAAS